MRDRDPRALIPGDQRLDDVRLLEQAVAGIVRLVRETEPEEVKRERGAFPEAVEGGPPVI